MGPTDHARASEARPSDHASPSRKWIDRCLGAVIGSIVTAWWLWPRVDEPVAVDAQGDVALVVDPVAHDIDDAPAVPPNEAPAPAPSDVPQPAAARVEAIETPIADVSADATPPTGAAPLLPLPRMPGDTRLSSSSRFDAETNSWILKAAFRVVAREHHVVSFYRKALTDQGLTVTLSQAQPAADGSVKTYLHGKSGRVHAQVGIAPRTDVLETRVWILWRTRA